MGSRPAPRSPPELPGILLAGLATLGLGLVPGPEAPLIALGTGLAILAVKLAKKDNPSQVPSVLTAAAAFAAIATIFGSPAIGAIILIEAAGLRGKMLPLILLPGLMSAGPAQSSSSATTSLGRSAAIWLGRFELRAPPLLALDRRDERSSTP